eukprot:scaffold923_cov171-Amphora_coffeaeformis.AAC.9
MRFGPARLNDDGHLKYYLVAVTARSYGYMSGGARQLVDGRVSFCHDNRLAMLSPQRRKAVEATELNQENKTRGI